MTDHPVNQSIATALVALSSALATLTRELERNRGFSDALAERILSLERRAATPVHVPTTTALAARGPELTTFERATRPVRDGQW
jgi:hypothetical protein